ncbi:MAG: GAF domain-containing sensor histidine kinase [Pseudomonadota bacterium]
MNLAHMSAQFWTAVLPIISTAAFIIGVLLIVSFCIIRWRSVFAFFRRFVLRRNQYDYRRIFQEYLERFNAITDRQELYSAILAAACRIVCASGASLVIRDSRDKFQIKTSCGLKPFSFDVEQVRPFLNWLEEKRQIVTRQDFVSDKNLLSMKSEGIRCFVQFNAEACVPLFVNDRLYGIINFGERHKGNYDSETRDLLKLLAVQFATTIHNANLYQALIKQNQDLQETSKLKTQLLANMSHELRTPLTTIIGLAEILSENGDGPVNQEQSEHLRLIKESGMRLNDTVSAMLDLSKIEVNRLNLKVQKVNIDRLVNDVAKEVRLNSHTTLEVNLGEDTPGVYGDEKRLEQVIKHVLGNAAKFTRRGKISIGAQKCGEMLQVTVKDTGIGIPPECQKVIFDGFVQADGSATRSHQGLGIGLTISKKLIELHGGRMWLSSKVGKGSQFHFTLPLKPIGVFGEGGIRS